MQWARMLGFGFSMPGYGHDYNTANGGAVMANDAILQVTVKLFD